MKTLFVLFILLIPAITGFTQVSLMYVDSVYVLSSGQPSFAAHRAIIAGYNLSVCRIYGFFNDNIADSILIKQVWFDSAGNVMKSAIVKSGNPDSIAYSSHFSFNAANQLLASENVSNNHLQSKTTYNYYHDTAEGVSLTYYNGGEKVYFPINKQEIEKKAGWDTAYLQFIFNKNNQLISFYYLDIARKPIVKTTLLYDAKSLIYKSYAIGKKNRKQYKFRYTHEFADGQYVMMKWDDGPHRMMRNDMACFYRNNQCFKCTQPFGTFWEYFYTPEGLLKEERQSINNAHTVSYKYYYY